MSRRRVTVADRNAKGSTYLENQVLKAVSRRDAVLLVLLDQPRLGQSKIWRAERQAMLRD